MNKIIKIAVDAMGGDGSPKKVIDGIIITLKIIKIHFIKFLVIKIKFYHILKVIYQIFF